MKGPFTEILSGLWSLVTGMRITLRQFFRRSVTVHYPRETPKIPKRFRGHIELVRDPESGMSLCIACKMCEKACPSFCIDVDGVKMEGEKRKSPTVFDLDYTLCSLCGACVEVCPTDALDYSKSYNLASTSRNTYHYDLLQRLLGEKAEEVKKAGEVQRAKDAQKAADKKKAMEAKKAAETGKAGKPSETEEEPRK